MLHFPLGLEIFPYRSFYLFGEDMRLEKTLVTSGDGTTFPNAGEDVEIEYTGWLYDSSKRDKRGQQ